MGMPVNDLSPHFKNTFLIELNRQHKSLFSSSYLETDNIKLLRQLAAMTHQEARRAVENEKAGLADLACFERAATRLGFPKLIDHLETNASIAFLP